MTDTSVTAVSLYDRLAHKAPAWVVPLVGFCLGLTFWVNLAGEPHFVDESAYVSQAYFGDLFLTRDTSSTLWFEYPGFDLPPLTKYLVWSGLVAGGDARPGPAAMRAWYANTASRFETPDSLRHARNPIALCGLVTVIATGLVARRWRGNVAAILAMLLLTIHPLFRTHARRAMADVPTEMGVILAVLAFLPLVNGQKPWLRRTIMAGLATGLAASSKLNGLLAGIVFLAWAIVELKRGNVKCLGRLLVAGVIGAGLFIWLNPFLYGTPGGLGAANTKIFAEMGLVDRLKYMLDHRISVSAAGQKTFPHDALPTLADKAKAIVIQGFGRFSPFGPRPDDSRTRYQWRQDWPALVWLPWVLAGAWLALFKQEVNEQKIGRLIFIYWLVSLVVVGAFLPLAWNRYFLPLAVPSILLAAGAGDWGVRRLSGHHRV